ncbi:MAG: M14 family zinc carboxypeptidase [Acidobacteriota bacterium]
MNGTGRSWRGALAQAAAAVLATATWAAVPSPQEVLGIEVGADRVLASYGETARYLTALAEASDRVTLVGMGPTVENRSMLAVAISTPENLARIADLRDSWARLADPRGLSAGDRAALVARTPSCALITAGIHGNEVAGPQAALLFAHRLAAAAADSEEERWLRNVVVLIVPSLNPDGQDAVVTWYRTWLGTPYEGSNLPALYHRYAGHDNNRDFVYLTQPESRALNRLAYHDWHPQLFLDLHQMGPVGPRQFVPPFADPIAPNVNPLVWRVTSHLGTLMALRLEEQGKTGVVSGWTFDGNWIGGTRNTGWWKNVFGVLTETAGAALATPIEVDPNELRAGGKGLVDYRQQVNFPNPWPGGKWGLADAVSYQLGVMGAFVEFASTHRGDLLADVATMAAGAVAKGGTEAPYAYLVPAGGDDPGRRAHLVGVLAEAGVEGFVAPDGVRAGGVDYPVGTVVFPAAQPLRQYLIEVLERQHYPEISPAAGADILLPYDITAWSMPLAFGVPVVRVDAGKPIGRLVPLGADTYRTPGSLTGEGNVAVLPAGQVGSFALANRALAAGGRVARLTSATAVGTTPMAAGSFAVRGVDRTAVDTLARELGVTAVMTEALPVASTALHAVTVGVYHPDWGLEDAGWLRFVLERAGYRVAVVTNRTLAGDLSGKVNVLVLPPVEGRRLVEGGERFTTVPPPPEYRRGIGRDGVEQIRRFFAAGGTVLAFGASAEWLADTLDLPVSNALKGLTRDQFYSPGAMLEVEVDPGSPLSWGMPGRVAAMVDDGVGFATRPTGGETARTVAARYPDEPLVLSGYARGEERLRRRAAVVEVRRGRGRAVLYAFAPYFRSQTEADFPLLFNAVAEEMMDADPPTPARAATKGAQAARE